MSHMSRKLSASAERRLLKELAMMQNEKEINIEVSLGKDENGVETLDTWNLVIAGPENSPLEGYNLRAVMTFPSQYPYQPPTFRFMSPVFHPNVYEDGKVCISILHTDQDEIIDAEILNSTWTPGLSVRTVCLSVISLLNEPNIFSAANVDASKLYRDDRKKYECILKERLNNANDQKESHEQPIAPEGL